MTNFQIGDRVGDYEVLGVLGTGGMGKVFRVRNLISEREEAMKVLLPALLRDAEVGDRFAREIKVHASLVHPNIAGLHTALRQDDSYIMFMELVEGQTLDQLMTGGPLDSASVVHMMWQVLSALSYAHQKGVIHRDIKPANIMVTQDGEVKVTDFGIARSAVTPQLTATGSMLGSLYYMSPEQIQTLPVDQRSDLYSLGVTMYEAVTGRRPFDGTSEYELMKGHLEVTARVPDEMIAGLPAGLSGVIMKSIEKEPGARFQSAMEFQAALRAFRAATGNTALPTPSPFTSAQYTVPTRRPRLETFIEAQPAAADLAGIQEKLAQRLGPIASRLVARTVKQFPSRSDLVRELGKYIEDSKERDAFLRACESEMAAAAPGMRRSPGPPTPVPGPASAPTQISWDPALLKTVKQSLSRYVGPIAGVLVDRTSKKVSSTQQLYRALAAEISSERDRAEFLRSLPG